MNVSYVHIQEKVLSFRSFKPGCRVILSILSESMSSVRIGFKSPLSRASPWPRMGLPTVQC